MEHLFVVCDLETSRIGAPYIYDISNLRVNINLYNAENMWFAFTICRLFGGIMNIEIYQ